VMIAVVYRPPKPNKDFLNDFAAFLGDIIQIYDRILILGDFNIHVCCPSNSLAKDFSALVDSFGFEQLVKGPTHSIGHTLDLVLSYGLPIQNIDVCNAGFSDHKPILFTTTLDCPSINHQTSTKLFWKISADTGMVFSAAFEVASKSCNLESPLEELSAEEHLTLFNSTCINILDDIAPLKQKTVKPKSEPWLNDNIRTLRQTCRRAEQRWKKDKLQVSYEILRDSLCTFQKAVKAARTNWSFQKIAIDQKFYFIQLTLL